MDKSVPGLQTIITYTFSTATSYSAILAPLEHSQTVQAQDETNPFIQRHDQGYVDTSIVCPFKDCQDDDRSLKWEKFTGSRQIFPFD